MGGWCEPSGFRNSTYTIMYLAWDQYKHIVRPTTISEKEMFDFIGAHPLFPPKPGYAWIVMKALILLKMELKERPWICGGSTLQAAIEDTQRLMDIEERSEMNVI